MYTVRRKADIVKLGSSACQRQIMPGKNTEELAEQDDRGQSALPPARGILRGYFTDTASITRYLEEERRGWEERERELDKLLSRTRPHDRTADS
jgi:hypothetical protein